MRGKYWILLICAALTAPAVAQEALDRIEQQGMARIEEGQQAQQQVEQLSDQNRSLLDEYRAELKLVEGLETYIGMLDEQLVAQDEEIKVLQRSVAEVAVIERQIMPLMLRMIDAMEQFVEADTPFLVDERRERVQKLRALLTRADVTVAEKCRRVFEAYQIENDYGRSIEAYTAKLELGGGSFDADFLRVGRLNLLYRTVGTGDVGYWDVNTRSWQSLEAVPWRRLIENGLKVARQEVAPELVSVALNPAEVETL